MLLKFAAALVALILAGAHVMPAQKTTEQKLLDGSSLNGWHSDGNEWQAKNGEIVGTASHGDGGWLTLNKSYEDTDLEVTYKCNDCKAGAMLREAPMKGEPDKTVGLYLSFSGPESPAVYRLILDKQGKELSRKLLATRAEPTSVVPFVSLSIYSSSNRDGHYFSIKDLPDGWKHLHFLLFGDLLPANLANGQKSDSAEAGMPAYGQLALRVEGGELRIKDMTIRDLTRPVMGNLPKVVGPNFRAVELTDRFYAEGVTAGDVNHDGVMDIVSGPFAYLGPDYQQAVEIYPPQTYNIAGRSQQGSYTDAFLEYLYDFNGDGWPDLLKINFEGAFLYINPKGQNRHWDMYKVVTNVSAETTQLGDVDADGKPELIMSTGADPHRTIGYAKPDWADVTKPWTFHAISTAGAWSGHGMGYGDVNGDGRVDMLQGAGWWEQPAAGLASGLWTFHEVPFGREPNPFIRGSDLLLYDVNGDGLPDVITSYFSHGPGLAWFEQHRTSDGAVSFTPHLIMDSATIPMAERKNWEETDKTVAFTELHAVGLVDMDGDGLKDIVTGKRWWSHGIEFEENDLADPLVMYWFKLVRKPNGQVEFIPHLINNYSGIGTQIYVGDVNGDGTPDVVSASRKGAFVFLNDLKAKKPAKPAK